MTKKDTKKLSIFHHTCLRRIIRVFWPDKILNNKLQDTNQESIDNIIRKRRWRWLGHLMRISPDIPEMPALTHGDPCGRADTRPDL